MGQSWIQLARVAGPPMLINSIAGTALFAIYAKTLAELIRFAEVPRNESLANHSSSQSLIENDQLAQSHLVLVFLAGALAGASTAWITTPIDQIAKYELRLRSTCIQDKKGQLQHCHYDWLSATNRLTQERGFKSLYQGLATNTLREGLGFSLFFSTYVGLRSLFTRLDLKRAVPFLSSVRSTFARRIDRTLTLSQFPGNLLGIACSGGAAGIMYQLSELPLHLKWNKHDGLTSFWQLARRQLGPSSLFKSFVPSAIILMIYDWSLHSHLFEDL